MAESGREGGREAEKHGKREAGMGENGKRVRRRGDKCRWMGRTREESQRREDWKRGRGVSKVKSSEEFLSFQEQERKENIKEIWDGV